VIEGAGPEELFTPAESTSAEPEITGNAELA